MNEILNLSLFQTDIAWNSPAENLRILNEWMDEIPGNTNLVILPEMFLTGFSMDVNSIAQPMDGMGVNWLKSVAKTKNITITGSLTIQENGLFYNRMLVAMPNDQLKWYNKRHLFRMGEEHLHFSPGNESIVVESQGWNIMPLVCYDLRFPVWSRNVSLKYDILLYVANWPQSRREAFLILLKARAIENQCYVVGVNRVGMDGNGIKYAGDSVVVDPKGRFMTEVSSDPGIINCAVSLKELRDFRENFPTYLDSDTFEIK